jgi:hypothetical protein
MASIYMTLDGCKLVFAATQAGLATTPKDATCQVTSAAVTTVENSTDNPATMCDPTSTIALKSGATLDVSFKQDWSTKDGFCWFTDAQDAKLQWFRFTMPTTPGGVAVATGPGYEGQVTVRRAQMGGDAGAVLVSTVSYPVVGALTPIIPLTVLAADADADAVAA